MCCEAIPLRIISDHTFKLRDPLMLRDQIIAFDFSCSGFAI
jgi:hypothetical protein